MKSSSYTTPIKAAWMALLLATGSAAITACDEGPFEEAGEEVDDAVDDAEDEL